MTTESWASLRARMLRALQRAAARGERPEWAEEAARMILRAEAAMWAAGVVPSPRPM